MKLEYGPFVILWALSLLLPINETFGAEQQTPSRAEKVHTIDWSRFADTPAPNDDLELCKAILLNSARWGVQWIAETYKENEAGDRFIIENKNSEHVIRPPSSAAVGLATVLRTGLADKTATGVSQKELTDRVVKLIKGVAAVHKANGGAWGDHWQSSLWSALVGRAGWMLWDELDDETKGFVRHMVVFEADRHIRKNYKVPYWNGKGGDSKAEENSWEALILQLAVAMMPTHPHVKQWKQICSELQISAFSRESDMDRTEPILDGKSPRQWLRGYNLTSDGTVINHGLTHCDYMCCIANMQMQGFLVFSLAQVAVPQTTDFNFDVVYRTLVERRFEHPPFRQPGGTMYIPGRAEVYYPKGTDWSKFRYDIFYNMDAYAAVLNYDAKRASLAKKWMQIRGKRILEMQQRHEDGHVYARGEFDRYRGSEQLALWALSDSYLLQWLSAHNALSTKDSWLAQQGAEVDAANRAP